MRHLNTKGKRNSLLLTLDLPYPTYSGVDLRNWQNVQALAEVGPVAVFGVRGDAVGPTARDGIVVWSAARDPLLTNPTYLSGRPADWLANPTGHPSDRLFSPHVVAVLDELLPQLEPDVVIIEHLWLHRYIDYFKARGCMVVFDAHNVEAPLHRALEAAAPAAGAGDRWARLKLTERVAQIEAAAVAAADQVWACSEHDANLIHALYHPRAPVYAIPNSVDVASYAVARWNGSRPACHTLVFPAMFQYPPNQEAALFLIEEVLPRLAARLPDVRLLLVGSHPTPSMTERAERDTRITVTGLVADVRPYLAQASVMVNPVFQGSGTRFKILEAFAAGLPVVSSAKGVEGLDACPYTHFAPAEDPAGFVEAILQLWANPLLARELAEQAFRLVSERYAFPVARDRIAAALEALRG